MCRRSAAGCLCGRSTADRDRYPTRRQPAPADATYQLRDSNVGQSTTPLLVFDAWEHAYCLQYKNVRPDYVTKLWDLVNWNDVIARFEAAKAASGA